MVLPAVEPAYLTDIHHCSPLIQILQLNVIQTADSQAPGAYLVSYEIHRHPLPHFQAQHCRQAL